MKVTQNPETIETYLTALKREIDLVADAVDTRRPVVQIHWGGGTPTYLTPEQIRGLGTHLRDRLSFAGDAEISLEADPRTVTEERMAAAASGDVLSGDVGATVQLSGLGPRRSTEGAWKGEDGHHWSCHEEAPAYLLRSAQIRSSVRCFAASDDLIPTRNYLTITTASVW